MTQSLQDTIKREDERFKKNCCVLRFGDGSIEGGGKSAWLSLKTPDIEPVLSHLHSRDEAIRKATIMEVIEMVEQEERFIQNILDGIDMADGVDTKAIRFAIKSRLPLSTHLQSYLKDNK